MVLAATSLSSVMATTASATVSLTPTPTPDMSVTLTSAPLIPISEILTNVNQFMASSMLCLLQIINFEAIECFTEPDE